MNWNNILNSFISCYEKIRPFFKRKKPPPPDKSEKSSSSYTYKGRKFKFAFDGDSFKLEYKGPEFSKQSLTESRYEKETQNLSKIEEKLRQLEKELLDRNKEREAPSRTALDYYNKGLEYYKQGLYDLAIKEFDQAIGLDPENAEAYFNRGLANEQLNRPEEAEKDFKKADELRNRGHQTS